MSSLKITVLYALFAGISTATNLGSQVLVQLWYPWPYELVVAVIIGTAVGLVTKYLLDKRYIFQFTVQNVKHGARTLGLYTVMSGITTLIFWGFEFGFAWIFATDSARYVGAIIGLTIGYVIKYFLDRKYTFTTDKTGVDQL